VPGRAYGTLEVVWCPSWDAMVMHLSKTKVEILNRDFGKAIDTTALTKTHLTIVLE
jgi:hypothetical protein